jgi:hypothetical protein
VTSFHLKQSVTIELAGAIADGLSTDGSLLATDELFPGTDDSWSGADDLQNPLMTGGSQRMTRSLERMAH